MSAALSLFHPLIADWFRETVGHPTEIQELAWPRIAAGEHVLVSAPTGSGKTLTAFLWSLQQLLTGRWDSRVAGPRVLYISPLRALNSDIGRNLHRPLAELEERFRAAGEPPPGIEVMIRSGDSTPAERRRLVRRPPEILITTPESLNILLTSGRGPIFFRALRTVILDEIHAVAGSKRGTHLITAVDRLVPIAGEFQRLALSATVRPMRTVANLIGGLRLEEAEGAARPVPRPVAIVRSRDAKHYKVRVCCPPELAGQQANGEPTVREGVGQDGVWEVLARHFMALAQHNRSTLFFANSRQQTEKVARLMNEEVGGELVYSHHGSLSREVRSVVERRLKNGELSAIVATTSLELGIDIGSLDEVVLVRTPRSIASAVQRVGRAGHGVGEVSHGRFFPTDGRDFLDAAVVARAIVEQNIEEIHPVEAPLDVLAQIILSMTAAEAWRIDDLHRFLETTYPYRNLRRKQLDLVLEMLSGRYADSRIRELHPRITIDRISGIVQARPGTARLLYMAGGTIADRGYFSLRLESSMAKIGELDEEFVWERSIGDRFSLGTQSWQVRKITHNDVLVAPSRGGSHMAPFWRADAQDRSFELCQQIGEFLADAEQRLAAPAFRQELEERHFLEPLAVGELLAFLQQQKAATGGSLPSTRHLLVEHCPVTIKGGEEQRQVILHTLWGGTVNRPLTIALMAAWEQRYGEPLEAFHDDDCVLLRMPRSVPVAEILDLVHPDQVETLLRGRLETTGYFGARFRINASTALLLPKAGFRQRTPLWMNRQRAKKLMAAVAPYGDFPVLVETWRTCLHDEFDLENLKKMLGNVRRAELPVKEVRTESPSPFAAGLMWRHTNEFMYGDDTPETSGPGVSGDVLQEMVFSSRGRPRLPPDLVLGFRRKVQRVAPGYAPAPGGELSFWVAERLMIAAGEWEELLAAVLRDHEATEAEVLAGIAAKVLLVRCPGASQRAVAALDRLPRILSGLGLAAADLEIESIAEDVSAADLISNLETLIDRSVDRDRADEEAAEEESTDEARADLMAEWARFQGVFDPDSVSSLFGISGAARQRVIESLVESHRWVLDPLRVGVEQVEACDAANLETLLRWLRHEARPDVVIQPAERLPLFLATHQGLTRRGDSVADLQERLEQLLGLPLPARLWETEILPARLDPYYSAWLDSVFQTTDLGWLGCGKERLALVFPEELDLVREVIPDDISEEASSAEASAAEAPPEVAGEVAVAEELARRLALPTGGKVELEDLAERSGLSAAETLAALWHRAWSGEVSNDTWAVVRQGVAQSFQPRQLPSPRAPDPTGHIRPGRGPALRRSSLRRSSLRRWQSIRLSPGSWFALPVAESPADALEVEEWTKERIRLLLQRYGLLCRELLARELPALRWGRVFRTLRLMELSGEVLAGHFFSGLRGLQFLSHGAFRRLQEGLDDDAVFWMCAADPASLCGFEVEGLKHRLPSRLASNHLVFHGQRLVVISKRRGRELDIAVEADHPRLRDYLAVLKIPLGREAHSVSHLEIETINGDPAPTSPYAVVLEQDFRLTREPGSVRLWKRY